MALAFLVASTLLQAIAVTLAVRIAMQRARPGWTLIAVALVLMFSRRAFSLEAAWHSARPGDPVAESIALAISAFLVLGLAMLARDAIPLASSATTDAGLVDADRLRRQALAIGSVGLAGVSMLTYLAYSATQSAVTEQLARSSMDLARMLGASAAAASATGKHPWTELQRMWLQAKNEPQDDHVRVIGADGRLLLDSLHPTLVGSYVGDTKLQPSPTGDGATSVASLIAAKRDWSGRSGTQAGVEQIAAYAYNPELAALIAVYIPAKRVDAEIWRSVLPWLVGIIGILILVLPTSIALLYRVGSWSQAQITSAQRKTRASEDRYRQIVETTNEGVWMLDAEDRTSFVNQRMATLLGSTVEQLGRTPLFAFIDQTDLKQAASLLDRRRGGIAEVHEFRFRKLDGGELWASLSTNPMFTENGDYDGALAMVTDVTERRRLEEQLRQSQKMDAVGQLAGGVAHDFNNLLTVIQIAASLVHDAEDCSPTQREHAQEILSAAGVAADLTRRLLAFSRKQVVTLAPLDLNQVVTRMVDMLRRLLGENVQLETALTANLPRIRADRSMIEQVIMNLVVNARDAMPNGGRLSIATREETADATQTPSSQPIRELRLLISDTGIGISAEALPHIFEPFYTTKEFDRGTGLGLATVYGIVQQHQGSISVESVLGKGTTFILRLPVHETGGITPPARVGSERALPRADATILLAEDDDLLRPVIDGVLQRCGYRVLAASSGPAALELWRKHAHEVQLLVTDLLMPGGMTGRDLAVQLRADKPDLEVIFMSGYGTDVLSGDGPVVADAAFIQKPYSPRELAKMVGERLNRKAAPGC